MYTDQITTTDLTQFGSRERQILVELLIAWREQGLPEDFSTDNVVPMMNTRSGCVFLTNEEYQCAMMNGSKLEIWHSCGNFGHEGFAEDCQLMDDCCNECKE
jgi:hypothetical protein